MNADTIAQQVQVRQARLHELFKDTYVSQKLQPDLLPLAFKELGVASEELQVVVEELQQQNEQLAAARAAAEVEYQRYQELFDEIPSAYLVTDPVGIIQEANRAAAKLLKVEQRFLIGKPLIVFIAESERENFHFQLLRLQQAQLHNLRLRLIPRQGEPFHADVTVALIYNCEGEVTGLRVCMRQFSNVRCKLLLQQRVKAELERKDYDLSPDRQKHIYLKGETIPLTPQCLWQVCQGIVKLSTMSENGEEVLVGLAGPKMPFSSDWTLLQTYQATALSDVELVYYTLTEIAASPRLTQTLLPQITQRLRQTEALLAIAGQRRLKDRFLQLLQLLKQEIGQPVPQGTRLLVRFTHQDLADACSCTRVTMTRLLGQLQKQGKITFDSKNHIILIEVVRAHHADKVLEVAELQRAAS